MSFWNTSLMGMGQQRPANPYGAGTNAHYANQFDQAFGQGVWGNKGMLDAQSQAGTTPESIAQRTAIVQSQPQGGAFGGVQNTPGAMRGGFNQQPAGIDPIYNREGLGMGAGGANVGAGMGGPSVGGGGLGGSVFGPAGGSGGPMTRSFTQNPYYSSMADDITRRTNLSRDQGLSQIRTNAVGVGGLGGSRQAIAEQGAISGAADNLSGQLANLGGGMWNSDQNRDLQRYQGDQGFYTAQRGQDYQGIGLGADLMSRGLQQQWAPLNNANNVYGQYTGLGTTTGSQQSGGGWGGAIGGALGAGQFARNMGWW